MSTADATDAATTTTTTGSEEQKDHVHVKERICDYYISARGCIKVQPTPLTLLRSTRSPSSVL